MGKRYDSKIISKSVAEIKRSKKPDLVLKSAYGRVASVIEQIDDELRFLNEAKNKLREIPTLLDIPTVVVAGYPNVGKSSFVGAISNVKPEIATYPFTTKKIEVGYVEKDGRRVQVVDTPGLLDRPLHKRNEIEKRAILCLRHLADLIVFIIDPTETCGYPIENQLSLLEEVRELFDKPIIEVYSKADLHEFRDRLAFSVVTGEGLKEITGKIFRLIENKK